MNKQAKIEHFRKIYPTCSRKEILDLLEAMSNDKYWKAIPGRDDAIYVIALTRAKVPLGDDFQAKATHLGKVRVLAHAAPYCRKGRVIGVVRLGDIATGRSIFTWPAFLVIMREGPIVGYRVLVDGDSHPFVGEREARKMIRSGVIKEGSRTNGYGRGPAKVLC